MHNPDGLRQLLEELRDKLGSVGRVAARLDCAERAVRDWLTDPAALRRIRPDNVAKIRELARSLGLDPDAYVDAPELWDIKASFDANLRRIPRPPDAIGELPSLNATFLGRSLLSPFGVSASVLTACADLVYFHAQTGSGVITYKTIRTKPHSGHPWPNIFLCDPSTPVIDPDGDVPSILVGEEEEEDCHARNGMLNRFGIPAKEWEAIAADFARARSFVSSDQLLILSVVGTAQSTAKVGVLVEDFAKIAYDANDLQAEMIELNLSCPNCDGREGLLYQDLKASRAVCQAVREAVPSAKVLAKIGYMDGRTLEKFVGATAEFVNGYTLINTVPANAFRKGGQLSGRDPVWVAGKPAGLSGKPIRRFAERAIERLATIRARDNGLRDHGIIGVGGVESPLDVELYRSLGADVVQATTALFNNSLFPLRVYRHLAGNSYRDRVTQRSRLDLALANWLSAFHEAGAITRTPAGVGAAGRAFERWRVSYDFTERSGGPRRSLSVPSVQDFLSRIESEVAQLESGNQD